VAVLGRDGSSFPGHLKLNWGAASEPWRCVPQSGAVWSHLLLPAWRGLSINPVTAQVLKASSCKQSLPKTSLCHVILT
jgi:hypothetical protein